MIIDLTEVDKTIVLQALYANAGCVHFGTNNVRGLTVNAANTIISIGRDRCDHVIEYINGKRIEWAGSLIKNRYLLDLAGYDACQGFLKAFEVLVCTLLKEEICIVRKGYGMDIEGRGLKRDMSTTDALTKQGLIHLLNGSDKVIEPYGMRYYLK